MTRRTPPRPWPSAWRRSPAAPTCSAIGEMGIGNTTVAAAILHALYGGAAARLGRAAAPASTTRSSRARSRAVEAAWRAITRRTRPTRSRSSPPRRARDRRDGRRHPRGAHGAHPGDPRRLCRDRRRSGPARARSAGARPLHRRPCLGGAGASAALAPIGKAPLLDLGMRLGEGTGAALAAGIVKAARLPPDMATFGEAAVARSND